MYKRFYIFVLIATVLASCTKEETAGDIAVQFYAAVRADMTVLVKGGEAQAEPVIANHAVLQAWMGDVMAAQSEQSITPGMTQISFSGIKLAGGVEYLIYIWVDCKGYYNTGDLRNVSVNAEKAYDGKSPEFDAFYSCSTIICRQDGEVHNVTLKRPFAKVCFMAPVAQNAHISFSAPGTFDPKTGKVSGTRAADYIVSHEDSCVKAFDYVFADEGISQMDYTFQLGEDEAKTIVVPLSRNTKTNILYNTGI